MSKLFALLVLFLVASQTEASSCRWRGMRMTTLDRSNLSAVGNARLDPESVNWSDGSGGLWFKKKAMIGPRFEIKFTISITDNGCWDIRSWAMDGYALVISKETTNFLNGEGRFKGYHRIHDSLIADVDLFWDPTMGDIGWNTGSFRRCPNGYCMAERGNNSQWDLGVSYSKCKNVSYDVNLVLENGKANYYFENRLLGTMNFDPEREMGGEAWIGIVGAFKGNKRDLRLQNAYICEEDFSTFNLTWEANNSAKIDVLAGTTNRINIAPLNAEGKAVPTDIPNYGLRATSTCGGVQNLRVVNGNTISMEVTECNKAGTYEVTLFSSKGQNAQKLAFNVSARAFESLTVTEKIASGYLKGGRKEGDYINSDYNGFIPVKLTTFDAFQNSFNLGSDVNAICASLGVYSTYPAGNVGKVKCSGSNGSYVVEVPLNEIGTYKLTFNKPSAATYLLNVLSGAPVVSRSRFTIANAPRSPTVLVGEKITSTCNLIDSQNNSLKGIDVEKNFNGKFMCVVEIVNVAGEKSTEEGAVTPNNGGFDCTYVVKRAGDYRIDGKVQLNGGVYDLVPAVVNTFLAQDIPTDLKNIRIMNPATTMWTSELQVNLKLSSPLITLIDFDYEKTSFGVKSGKFISSKFAATAMTGTVSAQDSSSYNTKVVIEETVINEVKYYQVRVENPAFFKKTSGFYFLDLKLGNSSTQIKIKYPLGNTDGEKVCINNLSPEKTLFEPTEFLPKITMNAGTDAKIGDVCLRTDNDCLYNYFVAAERFDYNIKGMYMKQKEVEGKYEMRLKTSVSDTYWAETTIDQYDFIGGYEITVQAEPLVAIFNPLDKMNKYASKTKDSIVMEKVSNDDSISVYFEGFDSNSNKLDLNPAKYNKYLGLSINVKINGQDHISNFMRSTSTIVYDRRYKTFVFNEFYRTVGKYEVIITGKDGKTFEFSYTKVPGKTDVSKCTSFVNSADEIVIAQKAQVFLNANDQYGEGVENDQDVLKSELEKVTVQLVSEDGDTKITCTRTKVEGANIVYESEPIKKSARFALNISYEGKVIPCKQRCNFNVRYGDIFLTNTQTNIVLSNTALMQVAQATTIANTKDVPVFNSIFFDNGNNRILKIDTQKETFTASITGKSFELGLTTEWINNNQLFFNIKKDNVQKLSEAVGGEYKLNIFYKKETLSYTLKFLGDGQDSDAGNGDCVPKNTKVDKAEIESVAGDSTLVRIELRTAENLRCNRFIAESEIAVKNNDNDSTFNYNVQRGNKKGTYIINFKSTKRTNPKSNELSIVVFKETIPSKVQHKVFCNVLSSVKFDSGVFSDEKSNKLLSGNSINGSTIKFKAFDTFGNNIDSIHNAKDYSESRIVNLFAFSHNQGENVSVKAVTDVVNDNVSLTIKSKKTGTIAISSKYLTTDHSFDITPGPVSPDTSYIKVMNPKINAGEKVRAKIYHRDLYDNTIPTSSLNDSDKFFTIALLAGPFGKKIDVHEEGKDTKENAILVAAEIKPAGDCYVKADFNGQAIGCVDCAVNVNIGDVSFPHSILSLLVDNKPQVISSKSAFNIATKTYPTWRLNLQDKFENRFRSIPQGITFKGTLGDNVQTYDLCSETYADYVQFQVCPDAVSRNKWDFLISKNYELKITKLSTDNKGLPEELKFPCAVTGGTNDSDASNGDMDITKTQVTPDTIVTTAGVTSQFQVEVRTAEGLRKNFWFIDHNEKIKVIFEKDTEAKHYKTDISHGAKPGQYLIKVASEKSYLLTDGNFISVSIDGIVAKALVKSYVVNPAKPVRGELRDSSSDEKIDSLPEGNADLLYKFNIVLYDSFNNFARVETDDLNLSLFQPNGAKFSAALTKAQDGYTFRVQFAPKVAGVWQLKCELLGNKLLNFSNFPGAITYKNTYLSVPKTSVAGQPIKATVVTFDAYNNYVDPRTQALNPVVVMFKYGLAGKFSEYAAVDSVRLFGNKPTKPINNFNKKPTDVKDFYLTGANQTVWIMARNKKCLESTKDSLVLAKTCTDVNQFTLSHCADGFYQIQTAAKTCVADSSAGYVAQKCDCKVVEQNFLIQKNFDRSFFINALSTKEVWTLNGDKVVNARLTGGEPQVFYISSVTPQEGPVQGNVNDGEIASLLYEFTSNIASEHILRTTVEDREAGCENCSTTVMPDKEHFPNFLFTRFSSANQFTDMGQNFDEDPALADPIYRIYARDRFGNLIPTINKQDITAILKDSSEKHYEYRLQLSNNKEVNFAEFVKNDDKKYNDNKFENLVCGDYTLELKSASFGTTPVTKAVRVKCAEDDSDSSNDPLDINKTQVREFKTSLKAMETGYFIFKLRTSKLTRKKLWDVDIKLESSAKDDKLTFKVQRAGKKGIFQVFYECDKANTFPAPGFENLIEVTIDGQKVKFDAEENKKLALSVSPADIQECDITSEFKQSTTVLRAMTVDTPLRFKVKCWDSYLNTCSAQSDKVNLLVVDSKGIEIPKTFELERTTGIASITATIKTVGTYTVSGESKILPNKFTCEVSPGVLVRENTGFNVVNRSIIAGTTSVLEVTARDQYKNVINADSVIKRFLSSVSTTSGSVVPSFAEVKDNKVLFTTVHKEKGTNEFKVSIDGKVQESPECTVNVAPAAPKLANSVFISSNLDMKSMTLVKSNKFLPEIDVILRDEFFNEITEIDVKNYSISSVQITGFNTNVINFTSSISAGGNKFNLSLKEYLSIKAYSRIVKNDGYDLACTLKGAGQEETFKFKLNLQSCRDDEGRGNGDFDPTKTKINPERVSLIAGETVSFGITLRTSEDKIFNDGVNIQDTFKIDTKFADKNLKVEISKMGYAPGIYKCDVTTTTSTKEEQVLTISVKAPGAKEFITLKDYTVNMVSLPKLPPHTDASEFIQKPGAEAVAGEPMTFKFNLFDKFGNAINDVGLINYFQLQNHGEIVKSETVLTKEGTYELTSTLEYPPRIASLQIFYKDAKIASEINNAAFETELKSDFVSENTEIRGKNLPEMEAGQKFDLSVRLRDANKVCVDTNQNIPMSVKFTGPQVVEYDFQRVQNPTLNDCINSYDVNVPETKRITTAGEYEVKLYIKEKLIRTFKHVITPSSLDVKQTSLVNDKKVVGDLNKLPAGTPFVTTVRAKDSYGNVLNVALNSKFTAKVVSRSTDKNFKFDSSVSYVEGTTGVLEITTVIKTVGSYYLNLVYKQADGKEVELSEVDRSGAAATIGIVSLPCAGTVTEFSDKEIVKAVVDTATEVTYTCFDMFGNRLTKGGSKTVPKILAANKEVKGVTQHDNGDGTYTIRFTPTVEGNYQIDISVEDGKTYGSQLKSYKISLPVCDEKTPNRCPAQLSRCVADVKDCFVKKGSKKNDCPNDAPVSCKINGEDDVCTASQTDCDCPEGMKKCGTQPFCAAESDLTNLCLQVSASVKCKEGMFLSDDGVCRKNANQNISTYACSPGFVLCPNLTCALDYESCLSSDKCEGKQVRCLDQSCADSYDKCPSSIVCEEIDSFVCPDRSCKKSEALCSGTKVCPEGTKLCNDGKLCVEKMSQCLKGLSCGEGKALCSDGKCKEVCNTNEVVEEVLTAEETARRAKPNWDLEQKVAEAKKAEEERKKAEEERLAKEKAEEEKRAKEAEEKAKAEEARKAEVERKIKEAEEKAKAEKDAKEKKRQEEECARKKAEEEARARAAAELAARIKAAAIEAAKRLADLARTVRVTANRVLMQSTLLQGVPLYTALGTPMASASKLLHVNTKHVLHSHGINYSTGTRTQEVTGYWARDDNDWFEVQAVNGNRGNGDIVRFRHILTGKFIYIEPNTNIKSPMTGQSECSMRPYNAADQSFHFKVSIENSWFGEEKDVMRIGDIIRFVNVRTNTTLHSHNLKLNNGSRQQEVTGFGGRDSNDLWAFVETR